MDKLLQNLFVHSEILIYVKKCIGKNENFNLYIVNIGVVHIGKQVKNGFSINKNLQYIQMANKEGWVICNYTSRISCALHLTLCNE